MHDGFDLLNLERSDDLLREGVNQIKMSCPLGEDLPSWEGENLRVLLLAYCLHAISFIIVKLKKALPIDPHDLSFSDEAGKLSGERLDV